MNADRMSHEQLAEIQSLDLLAMMPEKSAAIVSGHLAALLAEVQRMRSSRWDATQVTADLESRLHAMHAELTRARARVAELEARAVDRAEVLTEVTTWLVKKAREFRAANQTVQGDTASILASKIERGAIRADNTRMLPADFYEPGHTYTNPEHDTDWKFRVDTVTTHPDDGERTALGWRHFRGEWEPYAYGEDDYDVHRHVGLDDRAEEPS